METGQDKVLIHKEICTKLNSTYIAKNSDYGNAFEVVRSKIDNAILVRIYDKVLRLEQLYTKGYTQKVSESVEDTLLDLANYAIMELVEMRCDMEKVKSKIPTVDDDEEIKEKNDCYKIEIETPKKYVYKPKEYIPKQFKNTHAHKHNRREVKHAQREEE